MDAHAQISVRNLLLVTVALALSCLFIEFYQIEASQGLPKLIPFILGGFLLHALAPLPLRLPIFFVLNLAAILFLFGLQTGFIILIFGLTIIGISVLQIAYRLKLLLILAVAAVLAAVLLEVINFGQHRIAATVLGAMFMFRLIIYLYEIRHEKEFPGIWKVVSYFFLLPNLIFFIFPVVDYKTFTRNHFSKPANEIYRKGVRWILLGLGHLMLYRIIYSYLVPAPSEVSNVFLLIQYIVTSYLLILRLSGYFHLSVGILCLFGFNLPPSFTNFFTADGFNVLWRRINVYWKDFVQKVIFYPILFLFKKRGLMALAITTLLTFVANWLLHSIQWFWIRGEFPIKLTDIIFWGVFGLAMVVNLVYQKSRTPKPKQNQFSWRTAGIKTLSILGVFSFIAILWSLWISDTVGQWWSFIKQIGPVESSQVLLILAGLIATILLGMLLLKMEYRIRKPGLQKYTLTDRQLLVAILGLGLLGTIGHPAISNKVEQQLNIDLGPVLESRLNRADQERLYRGYYETLMVNTANIGSQVDDLERKKPENWDKLHTTGIIEDEQSIIQKRLKADTSVIFKEALLQTNSFGMRDQEYTLEKDPGTLRIALLGTSIELGSGVTNEQTYENRLEKMLNRRPLFPAYDSVEVMNFAISGIHMPQQVGITEQRVAPFNPDVLIYTAHPNEASRAARRFALLYMTNLLEQEPELMAIGKEAGITPGLSHEETQRLLQPYQQQLWKWGIRRIASFCQENGITPILIFVPSYGESSKGQEDIRLIKMARSLGFFTYDISNAYKDKAREVVTVRPWDRHPSEQGHRMLAKTIYQKWAEDANLVQEISQ